MNRRQLLATCAATVGIAPFAAWLTRPGAAARGSAVSFPLEKSDAEWRAQLTAAQYDVLRERGTERAGTSPLNDEKRPGRYVCAGCGNELFDASSKFESGTGWPSFSQPLDAAVGTSVDRAYFMIRTEVHCARCGGHLGHVFSDGPAPTGLRYCLNGVALRFRPEAGP